MGYTPVVLHPQHPPQAAAHAAASSAGPPPPPPGGGLGKNAISSHTVSARPTMSVEQQQHINQLRLEAELDRTRMEAAHNYNMAKTGAQVADMLARHHVSQPQHNYHVVFGGAPNMNPAPAPAPVFMKDNSEELRRIAELELANTTLHDQAMRLGTSFRATVDRMKGEADMAHERAELAWAGQLKSELRANKLEGAAQAAELAGFAQRDERGERERSPKGAQS